MKSLSTYLKAALDAVNWKQYVLAAIAGVIVWILIAFLRGEGTAVFSYGAVLLPDASETVQNIVGAITVVLSMFAYTLIWVLFFVPVKLWPYVVNLVITALTIEILTVLFMPGEDALTVENAWIKFFSWVITFFVISIVYYAGLPWKKSSDSD